MAVGSTRVYSCIVVWTFAKVLIPQETEGFISIVFVSSEIVISEFCPKFVKCTEPMDSVLYVCGYRWDLSQLLRRIIGRYCTALLLFL